MSWTKRQFIEQAFEEIGLASFVYALQPNQLASALRRLDAMMAHWNSFGVRLGYPIPSNPEDSTLDQESGVPDSANEAIFLNLAIRLAPGFGKTVSPDTKMNAKEAYIGLMAKSVKPNEMQFPRTLPSGAGNKPYHGNYREYVNPPKERLAAGDDSLLEFE